MMNYLWGKKEAPAGGPASAAANDEDPQVPVEDGLDFLSKKYEPELVYLKVALEDVLTSEHDDAWLLRFLVGTTLEKAKTRVRAMIEWRKEKNIADIEKKIRDGMQPMQFPHAETIIKYFPQNIHFGQTKDGRPISYELYGAADFQGLMENITPEQFAEFSYYKVEYMRILLEKLTKETNRLMRCVVLADLSNLGMRHAHLPFISMLKEVSKFPEEHYREQVGKVLVINTNMVFSMVWKLVKPVLNKRTVQKISITYGPASKTAVEEHVEWKDVAAEVGGEAKGCFTGAAEEALRRASMAPKDEEGEPDAKVLAKMLNTTEDVLTAED